MKGAVMKAIQAGDTVMCGAGTGIDGKIVTVDKVNNLAATAWVSWNYGNGQKEVSITKLFHLSEDNKMLENFFYRIDQDSETIHWKWLARQNRKVDSIKEFRASVGCGLKEAKDVVEEYLLRVEQKRREETERVVKLSDGSSLRISKTGDGMNEVKITKVVGRYTDEELLQVVANAAGAVYNGPRA
jgi:ribosomal protein L7/L12